MNPADLDYRDPDILDKLGLTLDEQARVAEFLSMGFQLTGRGRSNVALRIDLIQLLAYFAGIQPEGEQMLYRKDRTGPLTASNIALAESRAGAHVAMSPKSASGYKGVHKAPFGPSWAALYKGERLGHYDTIELAAKARDYAVCNDSVPGSYLNFPPDHKDCRDGNCQAPEPQPNKLETPQEVIDRAAEMRREGKTMAEIAEALDVSTNTLTKYLAPMGLGRAVARIDAPGVKERIAAMRKAGKKLREISEETGVAESHISTYLKSQGLGRQTGGKGGSGYTGVYRTKTSWHYQITRGGRVIATKDGFTTPEAAHEARQQRLKELERAG